MIDRTMNRTLRMEMAETADNRCHLLRFSLLPLRTPVENAFADVFGVNFEVEDGLWAGAGEFLLDDFDVAAERLQTLADLQRSRLHKLLTVRRPGCRIVVDLDRRSHNPILREANLAKNITPKSRGWGTSSWNSCFHKSNKTVFDLTPP